MPRAMIGAPPAFGSADVEGVPRRTCCAMVVVCAIRAMRTRQQPTQTGGEMLDLGIAGRRAIVCAASKGLGRACAMALARAGVAVTITARTAETLERTAAEIRTAT